MQKEKIEAEQKHISERKKQYFRENKRSIPQQVCLRCGRNKLEDSFKRNTDGQLFKTCITCMESENNIEKKIRINFTIIIIQLKRKR
jgi:hypothetical protein